MSTDNTIRPFTIDTDPNFNDLAHKNLYDILVKDEKSIFLELDTLEREVSNPINAYKRETLIATINDKLAELSLTQGKLLEVLRSAINPTAYSKLKTFHYQPGTEYKIHGPNRQFTVTGVSGDRGRSTPYVENRRTDRLGPYPDRLGIYPDRLGAYPDRIGPYPDRLGVHPDRLGMYPDRYPNRFSDQYSDRLGMYSGLTSRSEIGDPLLNIPEVTGSDSITQGSLIEKPILGYACQTTDPKEELIRQAILHVVPDPIFAFLLQKWLNALQSEHREKDFHLISKEYYNAYGNVLPK